jgi:lipopolysaccharide export system permease protein
MNLIHRHIFANVFVTCAAAVMLFGFVLMVGNALKDLLGPLLAGQLEVGTFLHLVLLLFPFVFYYALPMGMLTGVLLVLGRMSSDREITALRSAGVSVAWLSAPIIFLALAGVAASLLINFQFMPMARQASQRELATAMQLNPLSFIVPKTFIRDFPGVVLYVGEMHDRRLSDFWAWELDAKNRVTRSVRADSGRLDYDAVNGKFVVTLENAQGQVRDSDDPENFTNARGMVAGEKITVDLTLDRLMGQNTIKRKLKWLTFTQLMAEWTRLSQPDPALPRAEQELQLMRVRFTIQEKFATAFSVLSFALVAIPLGIKVSRKETSANLGLGLLLALTYYFASVVPGMFDKYPALRPDLLVWLPNILFQGLGLWLFYKIDRA